MAFIILGMTQQPRASLLKRISHIIPFSIPPIDFRSIYDNIEWDHNTVRADTTRTPDQHAKPPHPRRLRVPPTLLQYAQPVLRRLKLTRAREPPPDIRSNTSTDHPPPISTAPRSSQQSLSRTLSIESTYKQPIAPNAQILADRAIREEQDKALEVALERDRERLAAAREARLLAEAAEEQIRKQAQLEKERMEREEAHRQMQMAWRRWARRALIPDVPEDHGIRIAVRLPSGIRREGRLPASSSLETLHVLAETLLIPAKYATDGDPEEAPEGYVHEPEFRLVWTNPREELPRDKAVRVGSLAMLRRGVLLIMENIATDGAECESDSDDEL
ncbi:hypothetical protein FS749_004985 [Ceratobasidium sp. UAMH 11750]|nr:hypothetical protein FS749_004985 [Ceratobasidium sp. UAMH 11750]